MATVETGIKTWTIELRGDAFVLMAWSGEIARGPLEVRAFRSVIEAKRAAESESGRELAWRDAQGAERKHDVLAAADT